MQPKGDSLLFMPREATGRGKERRVRAEAAWNCCAPTLATDGMNQAPRHGSQQSEGRRGAVYDGGFLEPGYRPGALGTSGIQQLWYDVPEQSSTTCGKH
jgi:hypothetical protein